MVSEVLHQRPNQNVVMSLNPCFSGGWSRRGYQGDQSNCRGPVLILVLVEDGLGDYGGIFEKADNYRS